MFGIDRFLQKEKKGRAAGTHTARGGMIEVRAAVPPEDRLVSHEASLTAGYTVLTSI